MEDRKDPVDDGERLERYLEWRRADDRATRRWRRLRAVAVVLSLGLAAFLLMTWSTHGSRPKPDRVALEPRAAAPLRPDEGSGATAMPPEPVRPPSGPPAEAVGVPGPPPPSGPPARQPRARQRHVEVAKRRAPRGDVAASPASPPPPAASAAPAVTPPPLPDAPAADGSSIAGPTPQGVAQGNVQVPPPSPPASDTTAPAAPPAVAETSRAQCGRVFRVGSEAAGDLKSRSEAAADCVGGWVKGEVQEFRDGVKRQAGEFRAGFDRVKLGVSKLRSTLGGSE